MPQPASLIITHAHIFTADPDNPIAQAVAIRDNRIIFVGSTTDVEDWRGSSTRVIDGQELSLIPGIVDSHYHLHLGSMELAHIQLWDINSLSELKQTIQAYALDHSDESAFSGAQLRYEVMPMGERLTRHHLDDIIRDRPLTIMAYDHHTAWANTRALEIAGVLQGTPVKAGSEIVMGEDGLATGELREPPAYCAVLKHFEAWDGTVKGLMAETQKPTYGSNRERYWLREGLKLTARYGITSIHNMDGNAAQAAFYASIEEAGELTTRINIPFNIFPSTKINDLDEAVDMARIYHGTMLSSGRVKFFMDGVVESWTAFLLNGEALYTAEHFNVMAQACDERRLQITVHAIGDGAVRRTLNGFEYAQRINGIRDSRHRIEHIELIHPNDIPRFAELGVIASMQPLHCPIDYPETREIFPERLGVERWSRSFAWQYLRDAGARLTFGSDWPVVSQNPLLGIGAALTRKPWGQGQSDHRQSLEDTLISYTRNGAYTEFQEDFKGQIKVGMLADMVLLSARLLETPEVEFKEIYPLMTLCDGKIVYET